MKTWIFFGIIIFALPLVAEAQIDLNLQLCREMALQSSKEIDIAERQQQKAIFDTKSFRANYLPKLSAVGMGFYNHKKYDYQVKGGYLPTYKPGPDGKLEPNLMLDPATQQPVIGADGQPVFNQYAFLPDINLQLSLRGVYTAGLQLEQPIYMGGKVRAAHRMAKVGEDIAVENLRLNRSDILLAAEYAYWQLLRVDEQVQAVMKYKETVAELLKNIRNAKTVGMATENDVLKVQVRYNEAELMLQKAQNGRVLAQMNLCRLVGLDLRTQLNLCDTLSAVVNPAIWAMDSTIQQRPDYNILAREVNLKEREEALVRADFLPQIGVTAGYGYGGGLKLNGDEESGASFSALAAVKIPIFHWGEGRNKVRSVRIEKEISQLILERSSDLMQLEIASARFNLYDAHTRIALAQKALEQAQENLKVSNSQYRVGMENITALLEAQAQWQQVWNQWIDAKAMLHLCQSQYLKAIGKLE